MPYTATLRCLIAVLISAVPAFAANDAVRTKCLNARNSPDQTIQSCTLIDDTTEVAAEKFAASVTFSDIVQFVERQGWRVNLGDMCTKFGLPLSGNDCAFQQLSVEETEGQSGPRGFNVSVASNSGAPHVLIFHLNPLVGEFFVVSPDGVLRRAFLRFKGTGYSRVSNEDVMEEFNKDLAYWTKNFFRLKEDLEAKRSGQK